MLLLFSTEEFHRVRRELAQDRRRLPLIADMCRLNTLTAVKLAGSGHLGSSFSAMEIVVWLYEAHMNTMRAGIDSNDRDVYFSSKGHDVPGLYSVLHSQGVLEEEALRRLRKLGGLDGHPDVAVPGIEFNTGSLGMGISKGKGIAIGKKLKGYGGRVFVLLGDGELQEGQVFEALQTCAHQKVGGLYCIVDHNKVQTDRYVSDITDLGDLGTKFLAFGWNVARCDGHDFNAISHGLEQLEKNAGKPGILIADTVKGKGVSFMEHTSAMKEGALYPWHSGAPPDEAYEAAREELLARISATCEKLSIEAPRPKDVTPLKPSSTSLKASAEFVAEGFGQELVALGREYPQLVVLDGDLEGDCRLRDFRAAFPSRFIENGIAEQDMVSTAGGLARAGLLPVVNTFGSFLLARANEQIYNNACERSKIIYAVHFAGMIPAGPGKSHQSVRDISLFGALPNCVIFQPCNPSEARMGLRYFVERGQETCVLRMNIGPSPRPIELPDEYAPREGIGVTLRNGRDAVVFAYGPVMLNEALSAAEILASGGYELAVVNMPWLNRVDTHWLALTVERYESIFVVEDHSWFGGLSTTLLDALAAEGLLEGKRFVNLGLREYPACGTPSEVLNYHALDGKGLAERISGAKVRDGAHATAAVYTEAAPQ